MTISVVPVVIDRITHASSPVAVFAVPRRVGVLDAIPAVTVVAASRMAADPLFVGCYQGAISDDLAAALHKAAGGAVTVERRRGRAVEWRPVPWLAGYEVSRDARIWSPYRGGTVLKAGPGGKVCVRKNKANQWVNPVAIRDKVWGPEA